jgi:hypothetical protein
VLEGAPPRTGRRGRWRPRRRRGAIASSWCSSPTVIRCSSDQRRAPGRHRRVAALLGAAPCGGRTPTWCGRRRARSSAASHRRAPRSPPDAGRHRAGRARRGVGGRRARTRRLPHDVRRAAPADRWPTRAGGRVSEPVPGLVTLHLWRVTRRGVPAAVLRMGRDRGRVRRTPGLRFAKLLGTGDGRTFTVRGRRPAAVGTAGHLGGSGRSGGLRAVSRGAGVGARRGRVLRVDQRPVTSRGSWSGRTLRRTGAGPRRRSGGRPDPRPAPRRGRARFWRSLPPVSADLRQRPGLRAAVAHRRGARGPAGHVQPLGLDGLAAGIRPGRGARRRRRPHRARALVRRGAVRPLRRASAGRGSPRRRDPLWRERAAGRADRPAGLRAARRRRARTSTARRWRCRRQAARSRRSIVAAHLQRRGLRAILALEDERVVGRRLRLPRRGRQWWHDQVHEALTPEQAAQWLDGAVRGLRAHGRPALQAPGLGRSCWPRCSTGLPAAQPRCLHHARTPTPGHGAFYRRRRLGRPARGLRFPATEDVRVLACAWATPPRSGS